MKARMFLLALMAAALVGVPLWLWGNASAQDRAKEANAVQKWEYKVIRVAPSLSEKRYLIELIDEAKMEDTLNKLGKDGWDCVTTVSENWQSGTAGVLIFKRPKR